MEYEQREIALLQIISQSEAVAEWKKGKKNGSTNQEHVGANALRKEDVRF